ncbi:acyltransferase [Neobacillus cucumis]|uniref:acyltransferase family protein n=1 Tax=Neobacillus cucumis TaxID=1740721 RepID=UPI002E227685|nr:acyltransferase [Neobacillus cucumis]
MNVNTKSLDGFRFLLALWVCMGHFYLIIGGNKFFSIPVLSKLFLTPIHAVDGFMIITGFLMTYHYFLREKKEPFTSFSTGLIFIMRRLFRLYPVYIIAIIAAFFLVNTMYDIRKDVLIYFTDSSLTVWGKESKVEDPTLLGLFSHLLFVHGLVPGEDSSILSVAWSLSLEMQFYVLFPLIFLFLFGNSNPKRIFLTTIVMVIISTISLRYYNLFYDMPAVLIFKFPLFLLGMLMAAVGLGKIKLKQFLFSGLIILLFQSKETILVALLLNLFLFLDNFKPFTNNKLFGFIDVFRGILSSRVAKFGADISYSLYLFHLITLPFILKFYISMELNRYQTAAFSYATFIIINFSLSYIVHVLIEKPFIKLGKNVIRKIGFIGQKKNEKYKNTHKVS